MSDTDSHAQSTSLSDGGIKVSIIVPCYNVAQKIGRCFASIESISIDPTEFEVIFVDDCSTDSTYDVLTHRASHHPHWRVLQTTSNSGSPSRPRNMGVEAARGGYVFFLDADDEIRGESLQEQLDMAKSGNSDIVRASVIVAELGRPDVLTNRIHDWRDDAPLEERVAKIIARQSTTNSSLIRRSFLIESGIKWPEHLHMGEDTLFLINVLTQAKEVSYVDLPAITYHKTMSSVRSATQQYSSRDLASHIEVWDHAEAATSSMNASYLRLRGTVAIRAAVDQLYKYTSDQVPDDQLRDLGAFVDRHWAILVDLDFRPRVRETLSVLRTGNTVEIRANVRPRMLIAGFDLKFILGAVPALEEHFEVRIDAWSGHDAHDEAKSREHLEWADVIFCEWLLGNAVWYAKHKRSHQRLVVRMHAFELRRDFGHQINQAAVDAFFSVSVHTTEDMIRTFGFDRVKVRFIPNFIDMRRYVQASDPDRVYNLGLVGSLPKLKGLMRALQLLRSLVLQDARYNLTIYGKRPDELPWVSRDPEESAYYTACERYVADNNLQGHVKHAGWVDTGEEMARVGFVLSLSDHESFHVAPGEAFAAGNQALFLPWRGVEFLYPQRYIHDDIYSMRDYILSNRTVESFTAHARDGIEHVEQEYGLPAFVRRLRDMVSSI
jgi:glycosyltransferase involved in cell wall biosynthesis